MIPYGKQWIEEQDIEAVVSVLKSDFLTQGPMVPKFEQSFADKVGAEFAVAVNSATSALHVACLALGLLKDDIVWTSPISFVASSNCALYCGAQIDFVDIDEQTFNISISALEEKLAQAKLDGKLPKILIAVHLAGQSCDMRAISRLSQEYGFRVIEDASHAAGARYNGTPVGSCLYSDIAVFNFHPVKIFTSGEGGMAVTNQRQLASKMSSLRSHGITRDPERMTIEPDGPWFYQQLELGFNYRLTDIQAALGHSQITRLDAFVSRRHEVANTYYQELNIEGIELPYLSPDCYSSFHLFIIRLNDKSGLMERNTVFNRLRGSGVNVNLHYIPIYRHPHYSKMGFEKNLFPNAEKYYETAISIPIYPNITDHEQSFVIDVIKSDTTVSFREQYGFQDLF